MPLRFFCTISFLVLISFSAKTQVKLSDEEDEKYRLSLCNAMLLNPKGVAGINPTLMQIVSFSRSQNGKIASVRGVYATVSKFWIDLFFEDDLAYAIIYSDNPTRIVTPMVPGQGGAMQTYQGSQLKNVKALQSSLQNTLSGRLQKEPEVKMVMENQDKKKTVETSNQQRSGSELLPLLERIFQLNQIKYVKGSIEIDPNLIRDKDGTAKAAKIIYKFDEAQKIGNKITLLLDGDLAYGFVFDSDTIDIKLPLYSEDFYAPGELLRIKKLTKAYRESLKEYVAIRNQRVYAEIIIYMEKSYAGYEMKNRLADTIIRIGSKKQSGTRTTIEYEGGMNREMSTPTYSTTYEKLPAFYNKSDKTVIIKGLWKYIGPLSGRLEYTYISIRLEPGQSIAKPREVVKYYNNATAKDNSQIYFEDFSPEDKEWARKFLKQ